MDPLRLITASGNKNGFIFFEMEMLNHFPGRFETVGKIRAVKEIESVLTSIRPDVVIASTQFADGYCFIPLRNVLMKCPDMKVIGTSNLYDKHIHGRLQEIGACGYLVRNDTLTNMFAFIDRVVDLQREEGKNYEFIVSHYGLRLK